MTDFAKDWPAKITVVLGAAWSGNLDLNPCDAVELIKHSVQAYATGGEAWYSEDGTDVPHQTDNRINMRVSAAFDATAYGTTDGGLWRNGVKIDGATSSVTGAWTQIGGVEAEWVSFGTATSKTWTNVALTKVAYEPFELWNTMQGKTTGSPISWLSSGGAGAQFMLPWGTSVSDYSWQQSWDQSSWMSSVDSHSAAYNDDVFLAMIEGEAQADPFADWPEQIQVTLGAAWRGTDIKGAGGLAEDDVLTLTKVLSFNGEITYSEDGTNNFDYRDNRLKVVMSAKWGNAQTVNYNSTVYHSTGTSSWTTTTSTTATGMLFRHGVRVSPIAASGDGTGTDDLFTTIYSEGYGNSGNVEVSWFDPPSSQTTGWSTPITPDYDPFEIWDGTQDAPPWNTAVSPGSNHQWYASWYCTTATTSSYAPWKQVDSAAPAYNPDIFKAMIEVGAAGNKSQMMMMGCG